MRKDRSTSIEISENDKRHESYLNILDGIHSSILPGYDIKKILYNEAWFCLEMDRRKVWDAILHYIVFPPYRLDIDIANSDVVTFYVKNYRNDHDGYWKKILKDLGKHDEITVLSEKNRKEKLKDLSVVGVLKRLSWFIRFLIELSPISCKKDKYHLAIQLMLNKEILQQIEKMDLHPKIAMCFFDSAPYANLIMQYFKKIGAVTITNQHGQPVFRSLQFDRMNQSQILNFSCDYYLAKGRFTVKQFEKAGYEGNRIIPIGVVGDNGFGENVGHKDDIIGIYLDTPSFPGAKVNNLKMIEMVSRYAKEANYKYFIKTHPTDRSSRYKHFFKDPKCFGVYGSDKTLSETFSFTRIAIVHASSTYIDAYFHEVKCFKYVTNICFPIAREDDEFENIEELVKKINEWNEREEIDKRNYVKKVKKEYDYGWREGTVNTILEKLGGDL